MRFFIRLMSCCGSCECYVTYGGAEAGAGHGCGAISRVARTVSWSSDLMWSRKGIAQILYAVALNRIQAIYCLSCTCERDWAFDAIVVLKLWLTNE